MPGFFSERQGHSWPSVQPGLSVGAPVVQDTKRDGPVTVEARGRGDRRQTGGKEVDIDASLKKKFFLFPAVAA